jgi:hypothetical protein
MPDALIQSNWRIESAPFAARSASMEDPRLASVLAGRFEVTHTFRATSPGRHGVEALAPMRITAPAEPGAAYLLAVRHESSGAVSFHASKPAGGYRAAALGPATVTFEVHFAEAHRFQARSFAPVKAVKGIILKAVGKFADLTVPWIGSEVEQAIWRRKKLARGWLGFTSETLRGGRLEPADFSVIQNDRDRCLLFLHGTFSNAAGAFGDLASQDFFAPLQALYGDRIFAFNHLTVSQTPEQNARDLLRQLPKQATFDVITHSRGGLVLRNLVERAAALGGDAQKFRLGKAILVASPSAGTPLATADRFDKLISWWTNILEMFPENPLSTTAEYIGDLLSFLARHVLDALPGLEAMDADGPQIGTLQSSAGPPAGAYSALISNYQPTGNLLLRFADLGMDAIFGTANDLVVPTEGAWERVGGACIGCFGKNLAGEVIHTTYFAQAEAARFLVNTLTGQPLGIEPMTGA